jgi:hypothetical protein
MTTINNFTTLPLFDILRGENEGNLVRDKQE